MIGRCSVSCNIVGFILPPSCSRSSEVVARCSCPHTRLIINGVTLSGVRTGTWQGIKAFTTLKSVDPFWDADRHLTGGPNPSLPLNPSVVRLLLVSSAFERVLVHLHQKKGALRKAGGTASFFSCFFSVLFLVPSFCSFFLTVSFFIFCWS